MTLTRFAAIAALGTIAAGCASVPVPETVKPTVAAKPVAPPAKPVPVVRTVRIPEAAPIIIQDVAPVPQYVASPPVYIAEPVAPLPTLDIGAAPVFEPFIAQAPVPEYVPVYETVTVEPVTEAGRSYGSMAPIRDDDQTPRRPAREGRIAQSELSAPPPSVLLREASLRPGDFGGFAPMQHIYDPDFASRVADAANDRLSSRVRYDGRYVKIAYPWGDVPEATGVCTDVIIRTYRALDIDLQKLVHEDMKRAFAAYPSRRIYGLKQPDTNIDHRRVVNLEAFLTRHGESLTPSQDRDAYRPGDIVTWRISGTQPHIGIVSNRRDRVSGNLLVVHNIGAGPKADDILFTSPPVGHYRFTPTSLSGVRVASR